MASPITLANRYLHAQIDSDTGNLLALGAPGKPSLIQAVHCRFTIDGKFLSERDCDQFTVERVRRGKSVVESVLLTPADSKGGRARITRRFELSPRDPLLKVSYTVSSAKGSIDLAIPAAPAIVFDDRFVSAFEDEKDLYYDGAELGDGRELPCWRVFFRQGHRDGLLLATRRKLDMSRFQILERAVEVKPSVMTAYDTDYTLWPRAIPVRPRAQFGAAFEIGPWRQADHAKLLRAARLHLPGPHRNPKPVGKRPTGKLKGKVFPALKFAAASAYSDRFHPRKWQVVRVPWTRNAKVLFAAGRESVPPLKLNPKLKGTHRIYVGVGNGDGVILRVSGEREPIFRINSVVDPGASDTPFCLRLSGRRRAAELSCGVYPMDGRSITIEPLGNPHLATMIDYVRFEPLSPAQEKQWHARRAKKLCVELQGFADTPDIAYVTAVKNPGPEPYRANVYAHARAGFSKICWRIDGQCSDFPSPTNTMRYISAKVHGVFNPQAKAYGRALRQFDMLRVVSDAAREYGVELYGWMRFNNYSGNVQSEFFRNNPQFHEEWESGSKAKKLCLALPEVRRHKIEILVQAAGYGLPGLNLGFLRHPPILLYHPVLVEGFKRKFGVEPPRVLDHKDSTHLTTPPEDDELHLRWYRHRAAYMTQFGRELRAALRNAGLGHVKIAIWVRPNLRCLFDGIDIDAWVNEGLCDEVVIGSTTGIHYADPTYHPDADWFARLRGKVRLIRGLFCAEPRVMKQQIERAIAEGYDGVNTYESNMAALNDRIIEVYDSFRR